MLEKKESTQEKISQLRLEYADGLSKRFLELHTGYMLVVESAGDMENVRQLAALSHTLCGSAGTFGFGDVAGYCRRIEDLCNLLQEGGTYPDIMNEISNSLRQLEIAVLFPKLVEEQTEVVKNFYRKHGSESEAY